jgi:hypothetical protein
VLALSELCKQYLPMRKFSGSGFLLVLVGVAAVAAAACGEVGGGKADGGPDGTPDGGPDPGPFPSTGAEGQFAPSMNVVLTSGVHHYTSIDIPAGITVTSDGTGPLELRAQGPVQIAGNIDVSGSAGKAAAGTFGNGGGASGNPSTQEIGRAHV